MIKEEILDLTMGLSFIYVGCLLSTVARIGNAFPQFPFLTTYLMPFLVITAGAIICFDANCVNQDANHAKQDVKEVDKE